MSWEELEKIEAYLKENGYRNGGRPYHCNADHYWYKAFGKEDNPYEENRALWQVFLNVYDWREFWDRDPYLRKCNKAASITASIHISRSIKEGGIELNWDLNSDKFDLKDIEDKAYKFWHYVEESFGAPPKEEE